MATAGAAGAAGAAPPPRRPFNVSITERAVEAVQRKNVNHAKAQEALNLSASPFQLPKKLAPLMSDTMLLTAAAVDSQKTQNKTLMMSSNKETVGLSSMRAT